MSQRTKVLVVEDDPESSYVTQLTLVAEGLEVRAVSDGDGALAAVRAWLPDVVLLDLRIPGPDGFEVCRRLRRFSSAYVVVLTARTEEADKVLALSAGADDYLTKPYSPRELVARVRAMLRRPRELAEVPDGDRRATSIVEIDRATREVRAAGRRVPLTKIEFDLLDALTENVRQVHTRDELRARVWGGSRLADDHLVDVHMSNLRRKLGAAGQGGAIATVRGVGYRFISQDEA